MMSQKVSPGAPWVTMATVMRAVFALPAPTPAAPSSAFFPPLPLQPAIASARPATKATASRFRDLNMLSPLPVGLRPRLDGGREVHMSAMVLAVLDIRPTTGDRLGLGVEADSFRPVDVGVAEQRVLPSAEGVEGHRHRDRHVDADHP